MAMDATTGTQLRCLGCSLGQLLIMPERWQATLGTIGIHFSQSIIAAGTGNWWLAGTQDAREKQQAHDGKDGSHVIPHKRFCSVRTSASNWCTVHQS